MRAAVTVALLCHAIWLGGCATAPIASPVPEPVTAEPEPAPLETEALAAVETPAEEHADSGSLGLRAAFEAFERDDQAAAMQAWEDVLEKSSSVREQAHALLGMLMLRLLPSSPFSDPQAANQLLERFEQHVQEQALREEFTPEIVLLRLLLTRERDLQTLRAANRSLTADLQARDTLIRKLRALSVDTD